MSPFPFPGDSRGTAERGDDGAQELRRRWSTGAEEDREQNAGATGR